MTHDHSHRTPEPEAHTPWHRTWTGLAAVGAFAAPTLCLLPFMHGGHGKGTGGRG